MKNAKLLPKICGLLVAGLLLLGGAARADDEAGTIKVAKGSATVVRAGQKTPASVGMRILVSDRVVTGADGAVGITLRDNTLLSAGPNSVLDINKFAFDSTTHAGMIDASIRRGTLSVISGKISKTSPDKVVFTAPGMTLAVRGTEFLIDAGQRED